MAILVKIILAERVCDGGSSKFKILTSFMSHFCPFRDENVPKRNLLIDF